MPDTPEQLACWQIDAQLAECGWVLEDYRHFNPSAGRGIAEARKPSIRICGLARQTGMVAEVERRLSVVEKLDAAVSSSHQCATHIWRSNLKIYRTKGFKSKQQT